MSTYLIDIDGVICSKGHGGKYTFAQPNHGVIEKINKLVNNLHKIILFTARTQAKSDHTEEEIKTLTVMQLHDWGVKYHDINWTKPESDFIVDDKAMTPEQFLAAE